MTWYASSFSASSGAASAKSDALEGGEGPGAKASAITPLTLKPPVSAPDVTAHAGAGGALARQVLAGRGRETWP
jgi:hypothetical protein